MEEPINWDSEFVRFREVIARAQRRSWRPTNSEGPIVTLRSSEIPTIEDFSALKDIVSYAAAHGVALRIGGGGYGCFAVELSGGGKETSIQALTEDPEFQKLLARFKMDEIWVAIADTRTVHVHFREFRLLYGTNRAYKPGDGNVLKQYSSERADTLDFGMLEIQIPAESLSKKVGSGWWVSSLWKRATGSTRINMPRVKAIGSGLIRTTKEEFAGLLRSKGGGKTIAYIHGYANDFGDAAIAATTLFHNLEVGRLGLTPVMFSWPSRGNPLAYDPDTVRAEQSETALLQFLVTSIGASSELSLVAHSHGNKLLMRALSDQAALVISDQAIRHAFLCAPDIDRDVFQQKMQGLLRVLGKASLYMSIRDLALWAAAFKFGGRRAGQYARPSANGGVEIVDASAVSTGLLGHSYYAEARAVIDDVYYALLDLPASTRKTLRPVPGQRGIWQLAG